MKGRVLRNFLLLPAVLAVCAAFGLAQTGAITRVEQNDLSITYSGDWYSNDSSANSGGTSALTNAKGAQAAITFTGTGITWIGLSDPYAGIAWVYLDGTLNTVDTYTSDAHYQQVLFSVRGLAPGSHTLTIEVPHIRNGSTSGSWVWIDAFDIENGSGLPGGITATMGRTEQNNPALNYTGTWYPNTNPQHSGGSAVLAVDIGSRASINFNGTGITWNAYRDEYSGIAKVYLDGVLQEPVDTYLSPSQAQSPAFAINGLPSGTHSLTIEVSGTHNERSGGSWIWVDAFDVPGNGAGSVTSSGVPQPPSGGPVVPTAGGATRMEQDNSAIAYLGNWFTNGNPANSGGSAVLAVDSGTKATVTFVGRDIQWIGLRDEWSGIAKVYVDGVFQQNVDAYLTPGAGRQVIYQTGGLVPGTHTFTIETTGTANPASRGSWIWVDAFDIMP
ncbi:MAG: hypothetical protein A3I78_11160 [Gammaproteobacteria bacterium RIFCSPLOWO2_02_FULL_56_15]|nr:MAG: hypothetical protein A3I78_11160 [Gammaproteobacteria bacterium RIFCSPLOWO2_02_FULL_56_15]